MRQRLRTYQVDSIAALRKMAAAGHRRVILVAPTGSGKTTIIAELIHLSAGRGSVIYFLAHRKELLDQCSARLDEWDVDHGVFQAGHHRWDPYKRVQVASVMTLRNRLNKVDERTGERVFEGRADIIIIDEAHRSTADSYTEIVSMFPNAVVIGMTATPCRLNGRPLGLFYQSMYIAAQPRELVKDGFLMEPEIYAPAHLDLSAIKSRAGDYSKEELAELVDKPKLTGDIVDHHRSLMWPGSRTVVFATTVAHSEHLAAAFAQAGVRVASVDGETEANKRDAILKDLKSGKLQVVCNVNLLTEGWDLPHLDAVILARPTKSLALCLQMVGRVLRTSRGKDRAIILDHADNIRAHGFPTEDRLWSLDGGAPRRAADAPGVKNCPKCGYVVETGTPLCPRCGYEWEAKTREEIEIEDGRLQMLQREQYEEEIKFLYRGYVEALRNNFGNGGAFPSYTSHRFMEKYGRWPDKSMKIRVRKQYEEEQRKISRDRREADA